METRDGSGQLLAAYDYRYDTAHRLVGIQDSRGPSLSYQWSPGGRLGRMAMAPALGAPASHSWDFRYDAVGRLSAIVAPNGQSVTLALDAGGRLLERSLVSGQGSGLVSRYSWHPEGSLESVEHLAGASTIAKSSYGYDLWGQRSTAVNSLSGSSQTLSYGYDALGRLKSVANGTAAQQEGYGFDVFGNRKSKTRGSPVTASWDYQFDAAHQLTQVQQTIAGATSTQALLRFDDNGNLRKLCEGTSVSGTASDCSGSQTSTLSWDGLDQLVGLAKAGAQALSEAYAYDDAGRRLRKSSGANSSHYVYNGDDIAAEWSGGNALNGAPSAVYAHGPGVDEPLMRLTGSSGSPDAKAAYYVQDGLGSVVALFSAGTAANQTPLASNTLSTTGDYSAASYPPAHLKDGITVGSDTSGWVAVVGNGAAATLSLGSTTALERIELMAVSNYKPASFVVEVQQSSGGAWQQVASGTGDDFVAWADGSSVRAVKSFSVTVASAIRVRFTGAVNSGFVWLTEWQVWSAGGSALTQGFDAWGQVLQASGSIPTYGYTGREPDASGLMFYRARYYHPGLGQFISRDPLGLAAGINPYAYADGNPVMFTDPDGLLARQIGNTAQDYTGRLVDTVGGFIDGLDPVGALDQFGRKLASDYVKNNKGTFGLAGLMADAAAPYAAGYDGSSANGQLAAGAAILATVLTPGGPAKAAKGAEGAFSLLGANRAVIDPRKLTEYALNPAHPVGGNKARVFESALGFTKGNADDLMMQLRQGVMNNPAMAGKVDQFGARFTVDIPVTGPVGSGVVRSGWIYKAGSDTPELTTIFVK